MEEGSSAQDVDERQWVTEQDTAVPKGHHTPSPSPSAASVGNVAGHLLPNLDNGHQ